MLSAFLQYRPGEVAGLFIGGDAGISGRTGAGIERRVRPSAPGLAGQAPDSGGERGPAQDLSSVVRGDFRRFDALVVDNADALHGTINNLKSFAGALARNSDEIEVILASLERLGGGGSSKQTVTLYELAAPAMLALDHAPPEPKGESDAEHHHHSRSISLVERTRKPRASVYDNPAECDERDIDESLVIPRSSPQREPTGVLAPVRLPLSGRH